MDVEMDYEFAKALVYAAGWDNFLEAVKLTYPDLELYRCSTAWYEDRQYICKFRGVKGDLIIYWEKEEVTA